jgi:hypothetical protein
MSSSEDDFIDIAEITTIEKKIESPSHTCGTSLLKALNAPAEGTPKALKNVNSALKDIAEGKCGPTPVLGSPARGQHNNNVKSARKSVKSEVVLGTANDQQANMVSFKFGFPVVLCIAAVLCSDSLGSFLVCAPESSDLAIHAGGPKSLCKVSGEVGHHVLSLMQAKGISNDGTHAGVHKSDNTLLQMLSVQASGSGGSGGGGGGGGAVAKPDFKIGVSAGDLEIMLVTQAKTFAATSFFTTIVPALVDTLASTSVLDSLLVSIVNTPVSVWDSMSNAFQKFGEGAPVVPIGDGAGGSTPSGSSGSGNREIDLTQTSSTKAKGKRPMGKQGGSSPEKKYQPNHEHYQSKINKRPGSGSNDMHKFTSSSSSGESYTCPATFEEPVISKASDLNQPTVPPAYGDFTQSKPGDMAKWAADITSIKASSDSMKVPPVSTLDFDDIFTHMVDHCASAADTHGTKYGWENENVLCTEVKKFSHQAKCWKPQNVHYNFPIITAIAQHTLTHILDRQTILDNQRPLAYLQAKITDRIRPVASLMLHLVSFRELPLWMLVSSDLDVMIKAAFILTSQWNIDSWNKARKTVALMVAEYTGANFASTAGIASAMTCGAQGLASLGMWLQAELIKKFDNTKHFKPPIHQDTVLNMHLLAQPHKVSWLASRSCKNPNPNTYPYPGPQP